MSNNPKVLNSTVCKNAKSPYGEQLPARREHSSLGELDQVTHTTRKRSKHNKNHDFTRMLRNSSANLCLEPIFEDRVLSDDWDEFTMGNWFLPYGVSTSPPPTKKFPIYYTHHVFPFVPCIERPPISPASKVCHSFTIDASKALCLSEPPLECQSAVVDLLTSKGLNLSDSILSWIEDLTALYGALRDCTTTTQFLSISVMFVKQHVDGSIVRIVIDYLHEIIEDLSPQDSNVEDPQWLKYFRSMKTNWDSAASSPIFVKLSKLISMAISIGLCKLSNVSFSVAGVRLFSHNMKEKHVTAKDFFNCLLDTVSFFLEGGYQCFKQRSLRPLLLGDAALARYETNYYRCIECADLAKAGNLEKFEGMTENDFEKLLTETLESCESYCQAAQFGTEKSILLRQKEKLLLCHSQFRQTRLQGGLRIAPYAIGVFGPSGVGKSSIAQLLMTCALQANGYNADDDRVVTLNEGDKFMSNYKSYVNGVYIDDLGNTKADFVERSPAQKIIEIVNNVHAYATVAEAEMKGKIAIEPKVVLITRNVKEKFAHDYSNEPASILRREKITLTVRVRDQFSTKGMLDQDKVAAFYKGETPVIPDLWEIDVERAFPIPSSVRGSPDKVGFEFVKLGNKSLEKCSITDVIRYVHQDSTQHFSHQESLVARSKDISKRLDVCSTCKFPKQMCACCQSIEEPLAPHFGAQDVRQFVSSSFSDLTGSCATAYVQLREFDTQWMTLINCMPKWLLDSCVGQSYLEWYCYPLYREHFIFVCKRALVLCLIALILALLVSPYFVLLLIALVLHSIRSILSFREFLINRVMQSRDCIPELFKDFRDNQVKYLTRACVAMAGLYSLVKAYRLFTRVNPHGNLSPRSMADIQERDSEANPWSEAEITPLHTTPHSKCITHSHLVHLASKNLCHMSYEYDGKRVFCDAFFPCSNVALVPQHIWRNSELEATFSRKGNRVIGGYFRALLSREFTVDIPNSDLCLTWVANGGSWKDLTKYFPIGSAVAAPASVIFKAEDGSVEESRTFVKPGIVRATHMTYSGLKYTLSKPTFKGLCMAPIISETRAPAIMGFHLAGTAGTCTGAGGTLSRDQFFTAFNKLSALDGVLVSVSSGTMPTSRYDCQFYEGPELHKNSPVRFLPRGANIECFGSVQGRSKHFSEVVQTPISESVEQVCGIPNQWGKPKFHLGHAWQASLQYSCKPSPGMPGKYLQLAVRDYLDGFLGKLRASSEFVERPRPLNRMEVVCGVDGRRFIDKMPGNTSMGYPLGGPKNDYLTPLDPEEYQSHACPMQLEEKFWRQAEEFESLYLQGERAYPIFKGCLKDEPTALSKDKVRVFQSAPIELQLLIRKYFLPVARLLSLFPLDSECAVGINAQGPEWEQFTSHVTKFGKDRIFAGDYSKYDLRMPAQLVLSAFKILISIAEQCDYSREDLRVMEGIASEVAYPLMAYNGDLVQLFGSNPSGQNMTVFINGLVNSLLIRCYLAWKGVIPKTTSREVISLLTYGDDVKGSVKEGYSISIKEYSEFLAKYDMVFTMPDKDSELVDLMSDSDADFLKRKNVFVPEINMHLGALDEKSIFKSLHTVLRSSAVSLRQQCMMNIDGALREWFAHGREVYEKRRAEMFAVATQNHLVHGCSGLDLTYDNRLQLFSDRYNVKLV